MALEAPRPLLGARFYMKKLIAYLNNFQRKKLFCVQTLTKLPELTEPFCQHPSFHSFDEFSGQQHKLFFNGHKYIQVPGRIRIRNCLASRIKFNTGTGKSIPRSLRNIYGSGTLVFFLD
jgi:hypothetical protein